MAHPRVLLYALQCMSRQCRPHHPLAHRARLLSALPRPQALLLRYTPRATPIHTPDCRRADLKRATANCSTSPESISAQAILTRPRRRSDMNCNWSSRPDWHGVEKSCGRRTPLCQRAASIHQNASLRDDGEVKFQLARGEVVWLQGPSGVGKTTLAAEVAGLGSAMLGIHGIVEWDANDSGASARYSSRRRWWTPCPLVGMWRMPWRRAACTR